VKVPRPKSAVEGKRKVWGTLRSTTATAVKNTIKAITKIDGVDVKRKYHVKKTRQGASIGPKIQVSSGGLLSLERSQPSVTDGELECS